MPGNLAIALACVHVAHVDTGTPHLEAEITAGGQTFMGLTTAEYSDDKETTTINCKGRITA
jgi:hypothetical protein